MSLEYIGLKGIRGPIIFLEGSDGIGYEDVVEIRLENNELRHGRVIEITGDIVAVEVFEGTDGMMLKDVHTKFLGHPLKMGLSKEVLGRTFNGVGHPIDGLGPIFSNQRLDLNGEAINPVSRKYPKNFIETGISAIDTLTTLIRGQKLPIFTSTGLTHNELAVEIVKHAKIAEKEHEKFCIVFAAMGVKHDVAQYFKSQFEQAHVMDRVSMFINTASEPIVERILAPRAALTTAEYLAFYEDYHVLVIMTDMTSYCEALREFSSSKGEIPGRKGYPGYMYSDLSSLYERAGMIEGKIGSVTQIPILTMPNNDMTHPIPDLTGYITEGQIVLDPELKQRNIFPPINVLPSLSRLMKDGIGKDFTRHDHGIVSDQLLAAYAKYKEVTSLSQVIGEDELSDNDQSFLLFGKLFEQHFLNQGETSRRLGESLDLGWDLLSILPPEQLTRLSKEQISTYLHKDKALLRFNLLENNQIERILGKN
ncbi:V-type ATP synthase subunit B [Acholeplasma granularum]|uniref:V-type ATP synthase subunit B n=1 Tax=Acholeplasma granularum TaxID=264635 RepID=UPI0004AF3C2A|nr:V-type ATP synthase subunit B [Acholeplasma granularum]